jgi:hypothetical protein
MLLRNKQGRRIHVLAHSMGNRVLLNAVQSLVADNRLAPNEILFDRVALCAPDVAPNEFGPLCEALKQHSGAVTYYFATNDLALAMSRGLHVDKQAGLRFFYVKGMDTIDATEANLEMLSMGHTYYAESPVLRYDLHLYFLFGLPADRRSPPLSAQLKESHGWPYWKFNKGSAPQTDFTKLDAATSVLELTSSRGGPATSALPATKVAPASKAP